MASGFFDPAAGLALVMDNQAIYQNLLRSFIEYHQHLADRIGRLIDHNDRPELVRFCHTAKSSIGHVGSQEVQQQAKACEMQLKSATGPLTTAEKADLKDLVQNMLRLMDLAKTHLAALAQVSGSPVATPAQTGLPAVKTVADPALAAQTDIEQIWQQLHNSLDVHDPKNSRKFLGQLLEQTVVETDRQILLQVQTFLGRYQYAKACQLLDPIITKRNYAP